MSNKGSYLDVITGDKPVYTVPETPAGKPTPNPSIDEVCAEYNDAMFWKFGITNAVSLAITVVNMAIRTLNIFLLKKVGFHEVGI